MLSPIERAVFAAAFVRELDRSDTGGQALILADRTIMQMRMALLGWQCEEAASPILFELRQELVGASELRPKAKRRKR